MADNNEIFASVKVKVEADASDVQNSLKEIQQLLKNQVFKVQIESDVSGILNELKVISSTLHSIGSKPIDVKLDADDAKAAMAALQKEMESGSKKGADAVSKAFSSLPKSVQNQAQAMSKELANTFRGVSFSQATKDVEKEVASLNKQYQSLFNTNEKLVTSWKSDSNGITMQLQHAGESIGEIRYAMNQLSDGSAIFTLERNMTTAFKNSTTQIDRFIQKYDKLKDSIAQATNIKADDKNTLISQIDANIAALEKEKEELITTAEQMQQFSKAFSDQGVRKANSQSAFAKQNQELKESTKYAKEATTALQKLYNLQSRMDSFFDTNDKARGFGNTDVLRQNVADLIEQGKNIEHMSADEQQKYIESVTNVGNAWSKSVGDMRRAGVAGSGVLTNLTNKAKTFGTYLMTSLSFMYVMQGVKSLVKEVTELDTALTELRKTTDGSSQDYSNFMTDARKVADTVGRTTSEITQAAAEWSRSGYTLKESLPLGEASAMYTNISEYDNVSDATTSLIATMKAYGLEASNVTSILDKFNAVGNTTSTTSQGLGDAVQRAGSALSSAGNTLDESLGLIVAANNSLQNPEKVGRVLPTKKMAISVKLRRRTRPRKDYDDCHYSYDYELHNNTYTLNYN